MMAETGRLAVFHGTGKPFEIREYPVPEPEPGAIVIQIALANICGSDMLAHYEAEHLRGALELMRRTLDKYPWGRVVSHKFPLEEINEAFAQQDKGHVTRAAIVPN
jgi:Zn-dependent alcohol dehydrogenase